MKAVVVLEVMWDWEVRTTSAGFIERAPRWFNINPRNFTGRRLHRWLSGYDFKVTNACPELVSSAKGRGTPDKAWLKENLAALRPFDLLLVCGKVAQTTYDRTELEGIRVLELAHPAARQWNTHGIEAVCAAIAGTGNLRISQTGTIEPLP